MTCSPLATRLTHSCGGLSAAYYLPITKRSLKTRLQIALHRNLEETAKDFCSQCLGFLRSKWIKPGGKLIKGNEFFEQQKLKHWLQHPIIIGIMTYPNSTVSKMLLNSVTSMDRWRHKCAKLHFHLNFPVGTLRRRLGGARAGRGWAGLLEGNRP